jgi:hypothetical protein
MSLLDTLMHTTEVTPALTRLFAELVDGTSGHPSAFILNSGDVGLRSLDSDPLITASMFGASPGGSTSRRNTPSRVWRRGNTVRALPAKRSARARSNARLPRIAARVDLATRQLRRRCALG